MKNLLASSEAGSSSKKDRGGIPSWILIVWGFILAIALAVAVTLVAVGKIDLGAGVRGVTGKIGSWFASDESEKKVSKGEVSDYWAVFLANGQVYFGKLSQEESQYPVLKDVFYLRVQKRLQPPEEEETVKQETQLIKLGEELHGPVDEIKINRDQILFIEQMKIDSRVVQGIKQYYAQQGK